MILPATHVISDPDRLRSLTTLELLDTPPESAFDRLTTLAAQVLDAPIALISLIDDERQFVKSESGLPPELAQRREFPLSHSLCAHVVASKLPLTIEDGPLDRRFATHPAIQDLGVGAYLGVPLVTPSGAIVGTLCVIDQEPRAWRPDGIEILNRLADSVMSEIELRNHMRQVSSAYDDLLVEHSTLQERTAFLDTLLHSGSDMLSVLNADGEIIYASPTTRTILGYAPDELQGRSAFTMIHSDDRQAVVASFQRLFELPDVGIPVTFRFRHADGRWRFLESVGTNHLATDSIRGIVINSRDITERKRLERLLARQNEELKDLLANRTRELDEARFEILERLAMAAEYRDDLTGEHTRRVGKLAARLAEQLGYSPTEATHVERSAPLHDVGKIGISDQILLKPGRLTPAERAVMETHTRIGARLVSGSDIPCLRMAEEIALCHHERWDGKGYPNGLAGDDIPHVGRIVAVADVLDALTHDRPYKAAWELPEAIEEIAGQRGTQFDPAVVDALLILYHEHLAGAGTLAEFENGIHEAESVWPPSGSWATDLSAK